MNKKQYLFELKKVLKNQKKEDLKKTIKYYDLMIDDYIKGGMAEEEAVASLDTPIEVCEKLNFDIANDYSNEQWQVKKVSPVKSALIPAMAMAVAGCFIGVALSLLTMLALFSLEVILVIGGFCGVIGALIYLFFHLPTALAVLGISLIAISIVMISVKPFLKSCAIMVAISLRGLRRTYAMITKKNEVEHG